MIGIMPGVIAPRRLRRQVVVRFLVRIQARSMTRSMALPLAWFLALFLAQPGLAQAAPAADAIVLQDMLGQPVELAGPVQRAVTLPMPAGSLYLSLAGDPARLAGMHPDAHGFMRQGLQARIFPAGSRIRADVTRSGFVPNVETLLQIQPDLVWQWGHMGDDLIAPLRNAGLPVAALLYGDEARTREWIRLMGQALGEEDRAAAQLAWRTEVEGRIRAVTAGLAPAQRPRVMLLSRHAPQYAVAGGSGNFQFDVELAGGSNVAAGVGNANIVNVEQILAWNPEVILLNNFESGLTPATIYGDPMLADLDAVKQRRVYKIPAAGYRWDPPSQESPLYWQWLSLILQPAHFDWPLREEIATQLQRLYGYAATQDDIDEVLHWQANAGAQGYERFAR